MASIMFLSRHSSSAAMQTDEVEGVTLSKNGQVGAIKLAAEI